MSPGQSSENNNQPEPPQHDASPAAEQTLMPKSIDRNSAMSSFAAVSNKQSESVDRPTAEAEAKTSVIVAKVQRTTVPPNEALKEAQRPIAEQNIIETWASSGVAKEKHNHPVADEFVDQVAPDEHFDQLEAQAYGAFNYDYDASDYHDYVPQLEFPVEVPDNQYEADWSRNNVDEIVDGERAYPNVVEPAPQLKPGK